MSTDGTLILNLELEDKALDLETLGAKVQEQADFDTGGLQIVENLLFMNGSQC
jgi:hypothetical protein